MKIGFILNKHDLSSSISGVREILTHLQNRGVGVVPIVPETDFINLSSLTVDCDAYILKSKTELSLSLAGVLSYKGGRLLNTFSASSFVQDKIRVTSRLQEMEILVPRSYVTGTFSQISEITRNASALVKSHRRGTDAGIEWVPQGESPDIIPEGGIFIQELSLEDGESFKVYGIGEELFGLKGAFLNDRKGPGVPCELPEDIRKAALACGRIFNLQVYGVDILTTSDGPCVVDLNPFPHVIGVPGASERLSEYIYNYALGL
ncbi:MAG: hypothetical protein HY036_05575 [Nitrospirae bacterium]|nr:hypothetical protein [Nitrospirota bacterium]